MKQKKKFRVSIRIKTIIMIVAFSLVLMGAAMVYFGINTSKKNRDNYKTTANNLCATVSEVIDVDLFTDVKKDIDGIYKTIDNKVTSDDWGSDAWKEYTEKFNAVTQKQTYRDLVSFLRRVEGANSQEVNCVYTIYLDPVNKYWIYVADSAEGEDQCPPGCIDTLREENYEVLNNPAVGFPAYTSSTEAYGELVTAGAAIKDSNNNVVGYAVVDISMSTILKAQTNNIISLLIFLSLTVLGISIIGIIGVHFSLVRPIRRITKTAKAYDINKPEETHKKFSQLEVRTHDELADLADSMRTMENDVYTKIHEITDVNVKLSHSERMANEMKALASTDALTGVRNKIAYDQVVEDLNKKIKEHKAPRFAIVMVDLNYLKLINDDFGHNKGDFALVKLVGILKEIFIHSPIFRVGGDEFIILLKNKEYERIDELVNAFNKRIDGLASNQYLLPAEKVSAAIGYSKYNNFKDKSVDDVFKRADEAMYERKHYMKSHQR